MLFHLNEELRDIKFEFSEVRVHYNLIKKQFIYIVLLIMIYIQSAYFIILQDNYIWSTILRL